jgi:hypothetical protein
MSRLMDAICKACRRRNFEHDGRGRIEYVCKRCGHYNIIEPRPVLPPLARLGTLPPRTK